MTITNMVYLIVIFILCVNIGILIYKSLFFRQKNKLLKLVEKNKINRNFIYFLVFNDLYKPFMFNLYKYNKIKNIDKWLKSTNGTYLVSEAFLWKNTIQGYDFWYKQHLKWNREYRNYRNFYIEDVKHLIKIKL